MQINAKKTEILISKPPSSRSDDDACGEHDSADIDFSYDGTLLKILRSTKYLGVIFRDDLSWTGQFKATLERARSGWRAVAEVCCNHYLDLDLRLRSSRPR